MKAKPLVNSIVLEDWCLSMPKDLFPVGMDESIPLKEFTQALEDAADAEPEEAPKRDPGNKFGKIVN